MGGFVGCRGANMRICFICCEYPPSPHGGIGSATQSLARELVRLGHKVRVVGIRDYGDRAREQDSDGGVQILRIPSPEIRRLAGVRNRYQLYQQVAALVRRGEVDLLEVPDFEGWTAGWKSLEIPIVMRLQGSVSYFAHETGQPISRVIFEVERLALRSASFHCSASRYTAEVTRGLFRLKKFEPKVLYNPVRIPAPGHGWSPSGCKVVFTGTLTAKKGVVHLVRAWPHVVHALPEAQLHLYGRDGKSPSGGSMQEYLLSQLPDSARHSIVFHGGVSNEVVLEALRSAQVGVFPSFSEAFGVAPIESMAQGCPTVYSRLSSGPELITDGEDGLLIDPANEKQIAEAIIKVIGDRDLSKRLGIAGRFRAENFSVESLGRQNLAFYQQCLERFPASPTGHINRS
jgi:glycosyltransferase involved in cell wall biosynthesis